MEVNIIIVIPPNLYYTEFSHHVVTSILVLEYMDTSLKGPSE